MNNLIERVVLVQGKGQVLKAHYQLHHCGRSMAHNANKLPDTFVANRPSEVFCWDITYLTSVVRGRFYYLYMLEDIFSRKIMGVEVYECESGEYAAELLQRTLIRENALHTRV